jgi:hypothetical protein
VIVVGPRENVFHYLLPDSQIFATWNKAFATIGVSAHCVRKRCDGRRRQLRNSHTAPVDPLFVAKSHLLN